MRELSSFLFTCNLIFIIFVIRGLIMGSIIEIKNKNKK